jgi:hypothetical protein
MLARAAIAMWWDIAPAVRAEWEHWHSSEHMPERAGLSGFLRGTRWIALSGKPSYFVFYEAARLSAITGGAYLRRLNDPTPWSRKMMPHHRNMVRSLCRIRAGTGGGVSGFLATVRFSPTARSRMPKLPKREGVTATWLLESMPQSRPGAGRPATTEQKIRGADRSADWAFLIGGYDAQAVKRAAREVALPGAIVGLYRLAFSLSGRDL